jgi:hypothetical protein
MRNYVRRWSRKALLLPLLAGVVLVLAPLPFWTTLALWPRWIAILALAWWLPGALLVALWRLPDLDLPTAAVLAAGLGLCWMILLALLIHWLPGPISLGLFVGTYEVGALVLLVALILRPPVALRAVPTTTWLWLAAVLALAVLLRLPGIGYHELHVDEVVVLNRAENAIQGEDDILARHTKGPGEIAIALVVYRALDTANELTARLPFGLMSVGSVLAVAVLGRRLFSPATGFWAGVLFALNGFALGLSRIVQYQPAVLLLSALAVLAAWAFARRGEGRWLALAAIFGAFGLVMHYEFGLVAPALVFLAWRGWQRASHRRSVVSLAVPTGVACTLLVAAVYLPALLNPHFEKTQDYLGTRLGALGAFNGAFFVEMGTFYNSIYFFAGLMALMLAGLVIGWRVARRRTAMLALWFLPFFILYIFIMQFPGTHFYLLMESWSLLAALPLALVTRPGTLRPRARQGVLALVAVWLAVSAGYLYLMFFRQAPGYVINYDQARLPFYWAPYGKDIPEKPRFGLPIREGWKALGVLAKWGYLEGTFASNEASNHLPGWYLDALDRTRLDRQPDFIFVADHVQEADPAFNDDLLEAYQQVGEVRVRGEPRIQVWARQPLPVAYVAYDVEPFEGIFDRTVPPLDRWPDPPVQARKLALGETLSLESAGLAQTALSAGDTLHLLLVWRPHQALDRDYKLFVHVAGADNRPLAQWDGLPCQNTAWTSQWPAGQAVRDQVLLPLPTDMPPGEYRVLVGLYDGESGERLGGQALAIGTISVH